MHTRNLAVGTVARDDVHLLLPQRAIQQAQVHHARLALEVQAVGLLHAAQAVRALLKLVAHAPTQLRCCLLETGQVRHLQAVRIGLPHHHGKGIFKAQRR